MSSNRTIDDDMLSAYLDGELPAEEQQAVRAAVASDPVLAARLAALQSVNELVLRHAQALDVTPLPTGVLALLQTGDKTESPAPLLEDETSAKVVQGPWQGWSRRTGAKLALAASLVLALGLALINLLEAPASELPALAAYTQALETSPSGTPVAVNGATLLNRFSFRDREGRYCRQYQLSTPGAGAENIACRTEQGWSLAASLAMPVQAAPDTYQPASASPELNAVLDSMMDGAALDLATEASLIARDWQGE